MGWIPLYAGVAGGADVILIPEIPYDMDNVVAAIERREEKGGRFAIVVVAEGAISREEAAMKKKAYKAKVAARDVYKRQPRGESGLGWKTGP